MRYTSFKLPENRYVPGENERPQSELLHEENISPKSLSVKSPAENGFFLYGLDLFNHHYFWEAHEVWEVIWHLEENHDLIRFLQGMIQLSGGFLKVIQGNEKGARLLWGKAVNRLSSELLEETGLEIDTILAMIREDDLVQKLTLEHNFSQITLKGIMPLL